MAPQDSFIEEEGDTCPLCIEDFDLSDRNFRPCPCGYQVRQTHGCYLFCRHIDVALFQGLPILLQQH
jgi:hypothetical protein